MPTESDALRLLSQWLKQYKCTVLQDQKNDLNNPVFHIKGESLKKPDLIASKNNYTIAIEVKSGTDSRVLGQYSKNMLYFENYNDDKTFYFDDKNNIIGIDDFVIGTYFSPKGHLCENEVLHIDKKRANGIKYNACPKKEYASSYMIIRRGIWDNIQKNKYRKYCTGVGALLSATLDDKKCIPAAFVMKPNRYTHKWKPTWDGGAYYE